MPSLDPLPPNPMDLLGNLVDALWDAGLQANPWSQVKVSASPYIGMHMEVSCQTLT